MKQVRPDLGMTATNMPIPMLYLLQISSLGEVFHYSPLPPFCPGGEGGLVN